MRRARRARQRPPRYQAPAVSPRFGASLSSVTLCPPPPAGGYLFLVDLDDDTPSPAGSLETAASRSRRLLATDCTGFGAPDAPSCGDAISTGTIGCAPVDNQASPSARNASFTFGRSPTRAMNLSKFGQGARSIDWNLVQLRMVNR